MGLFSFTKNVGKKLFGKEETTAAKVSDQMQEKMQAQLNNARAESLFKTVNSMDLGVEGLNITVDNDEAIVKGKAPSQAAREKAVIAIGNVAGIATVHDFMEVEETVPEATMYTVQKGDSLSKIAKAHYGNAMKYPVIFEANRPMLADPDSIYPGQVLRIPPMEEAS